MKNYVKFHVELDELPMSTTEELQLRVMAEGTGTTPELPTRTARVVFEGFQGGNKPEVIMADQPISVAHLLAAHLNRAYSFGFARGRDVTKQSILNNLGFPDPLIDG